MNPAKLPFMGSSRSRGIGFIYKIDGEIKEGPAIPAHRQPIHIYTLILLLKAAIQQRQMCNARRVEQSFTTEPLIKKNNKTRDSGLQPRAIC